MWKNLWKKKCFFFTKILKLLTFLVKNPNKKFMFFLVLYMESPYFLIYLFSSSPFISPTFPVQGQHLKSSVRKAKHPAVAKKLDRVGPVDNRPSTDKLHHFVKKKKRKKRKKMSHVTHDTWYMTHDTWHMTCNLWHVTCCGGWTFFQNLRSLALLVCDLWYFED